LRRGDLSQGVVAVELDPRHRNVEKIDTNLFVLTCQRHKCRRRHLVPGPVIYRAVTEAMQNQQSRVRHVYLRDLGPAINAALRDAIRTAVLDEDQ
jgi:hypothetical protein